MLAATRSQAAGASHCIAKSCHARVTAVKPCVLAARSTRTSGLHQRQVPRLGRHCTKAAVETLQAEAAKVLKEEEEEEEFDDLHSDDDSGALTTHQVQALLNVVCGETEIAEMELKVGGFSMKVRRKMTSAAAASYAPPAAPSAVPANEMPFQSTSSIDESQLLPSSPVSGSGTSIDEEDLAEENLLYIGAPKVGILRRGRYIKGKRVGKGMVAEVGARVKKGQPLAFIEQLGTYVPVEAPQAGEIVSFVVEEGKAVEYKEVIVEIAPFFGGHIIGDKKYA